ncbi:MAG TPA: CopD family protein [Candidatus Binataceae bacterium]|nr:CopD family protein [Candidatus Binataceae bacterium]
MMGTMSHAGGMADPFGIRAWCEMPFLTALLLVFGLAAFALMILPPQSELESAAAQILTAMRVLAMVALMMAPLQVLTGVASMAGTTLVDALPLAAEVLRQTHFGKVWVASAPLLLAMAAATWIPRRSRSRAWLIALIGAALLMLRAFASHAVDFGTPAIVLYVVHEGGAALWGGALLGLLFVARRGELERPAAALVVQRVSRLAGWCVALLVASGVYIAYCCLGLSLDHLLYSAYGRTLVAKVTVFAVIAALGGYNRYWLMPQFSAASARSHLMRSVRIECCLMAGVLVLAVLLANTPPAH